MAYLHICIFYLIFSSTLTSDHGHGQRKVGSVIHDKDKSKNSEIDSVVNVYRYRDDDTDYGLNNEHEDDVHKSRSGNNNHDSLQNNVQNKNRGKSRYKVKFTDSDDYEPESDDSVLPTQTYFFFPGSSSSSSAVPLTHHNQDVTTNNQRNKHENDSGLVRKAFHSDDEEEDEEEVDHFYDRHVGVHDHEDTESGGNIYRRFRRNHMNIYATPTIKHHMSPSTSHHHVVHREDVPTGVHDHNHKPVDDDEDEEEDDDDTDSEMGSGDGKIVGHPSTGPPEVHRGHGHGGHGNKHRNPSKVDDDIIPDEDENEILTRIVPSFASPTFTTTTIFPTARIDSAIEMSTPTVSPDNIRQTRKWTNLYTTPTLKPEVAPTEEYFPEEGEDDVPEPTPTPIFVSATPILNEVTSPSVSDISPSAPVTVTESTKMVDERLNEIDHEGTTSKGDSPPVVTPTSPPIETTPSHHRGHFVPTNTAPTVRRRIPKISITAGQWFRYYIPEETFYDEQDGTTRNLKLGFYLKDSENGRRSSGQDWSSGQGWAFNRNTGTEETPSADHWIQFNTENQFLYALPTEKFIGRHEFILMAIDSNGEMVQETVQINVRQHRASRSFNHFFSLMNTTWDVIKYPVLIDATEKLLDNIATQVFGDGNIESFNVQSIDIHGGNKGDRSYSITWTNSSLPAHPCPRKVINNLYNKLADASGRKPGHTSSSHSSSSHASAPLVSEPSRTLRKVLGQEFRVKSVGLRFDVSCGSNVPTATESSNKQSNVPITRNKIDLIQIKLGTVFRYKIPRDTFYSPKGGDTRELDLSILTIDGKTLPSDGPIGFDTVNQEIYALALDSSASNGIITSINTMKKPKLLQPEEYMLVARDIESGGIATEAFVVEYLREGDSYSGQSRSDYKRPDTFEVIMTLAPTTNSELDLETRVNLMYRLATSVLSDSDPDAIKVVSWRKGKYIANYHELPSQSNGNRGSQVSTPHSHSKREASSWSTSDGDQHHATFYEIVWTNKTLQNLEACPADSINNNIITPIFKQKSVEDLSRSFEPDFNLLHMSFRPIGSCVNYLQNQRVGDEPVAIVILDPVITTSKPPAKEDDDDVDDDGSDEGNNKINPILSSRPSSEDASFDESDREYYMTSILPALITITIMLIVALIIVCILVRYRRSQEKTRFEVTTGIVSGLSSGHLASGLRTPAGDHWSAEREAFLGKGGRAPVIFEQEMQQQQALLANQSAVQSPYGFTYAPVMMPPPPPMSGHPSQSGHYGMIGAVPTVQHHQIHQMTPIRTTSLHKSPYASRQEIQQQQHQLQQQQQQQHLIHGSRQLRQSQQPPPAYYK